MLIPTMKIETAFKIAAAVLVVLTAGILYAKGCARAGSDINQQIQKETISVQRQSIEISNTTHKKVYDEQASTQQQSDAAVRTILGGKGGAVPAPGVHAAPPAKGGPKEASPSDPGDLAGPPVDDDCDLDCVMRVTGEAKDAAARAACKLRGTGPCDHAGRPAK